MKTTIILTCLILAIMIISQSFVAKGTKETEAHAYTVLKVYDQFEIRKYAPALFSSVKLKSKGYKESSGKGFRMLAGYIFGNNEKNQKIAMTTPVVMQLGDTTKMFFKVPDGYSMEALPQPNDTNIVFEKQEEKIMAAIHFNGWADDDKIKHYIAILKNALDKENIQHTNAFSFLGYNPPYELVNRRNEIAVELIQCSNQK
ncbi:MAG: SOUL family heme-binding protein [Bacteroidota bacterium]|jgi:hypothetical protein